MPLVQVVTVISPDGAEEHTYEDASYEFTVDRSWLDTHPDHPVGHDPGCVVCDGSGRVTYEEHGLIVRTPDGQPDMIYPYGQWKSVSSRSVHLEPPPEPPPVSIRVRNAAGLWGTLDLLLPPGYTLVEQEQPPTDEHDLAVVDQDGNRTTLPVRVPSGLIPAPPRGEP